MAKKRAVYPGTFDPVTYGHIDLINRARKIFDEVIVAVADNAVKNPLFTKDERIDMLKQSTRGLKGVTVEGFDELMVDYVQRKNINVVIRGLRMLSDFEYEFQMALTNRKLNDNIEIIFMMPKESYSFVSSKLIKEVALWGANLSQFVPPFVETKLRKAFKK
ncbi:MAG: pantetheine-phosphate adenylyltransferase [Candidatus Omnitrophica bacterium]|nr:pantetheine-phosphate adenylyltransferase [Candidatus Omnitrophota bacterium]MBU4477487.1 pantetheine-phosphate adenylyltransferase [Candidatus Omnitrophota bacterium]